MRRRRTLAPSHLKPANAQKQSKGWRSLAASTLQMGERS